MPRAWMIPHAQMVALYQWRWAFAAPGRREFTRQSCAYSSFKKSLTEGVRQLSDLIEPRLHGFWHVL
jgi:hypothetical protein